MWCDEWLLSAGDAPRDDAAGDGSCDMRCSPAVGRSRPAGSNLAAETAATATAPLPALGLRPLPAEPFLVKPPSANWSSQPLAIAHRQPLPGLLAPRAVFMKHSLSERL